MTDKDISVPEITEDKLHTVDDEAFRPDHCCIVTGAASGIGRATALAAAANGLTVAATDIDGAGLASTRERAEELNTEGHIETITADLRQDDDIERVVEEAVGYGDIRYLANIAGVQHIDPIEEFPMDTYDAIHDVMVRAPLYLSKRCLPHIRDTDDGRGAIGNMASVHSHYVTAEKVAYNVSKFGVRGLTQSIAAEGDGKVRSFSISTGYVRTPLVTGQVPETAESRGIGVDEVIEDVMLGQARTAEMMAPVDVANLFVIGFSRLARHLNGGDLLFDGGMTLTYE